MRNFIKKHTLFTIYSVIILGLIYGVILTSGATYLHYISVFVISFVLSYFIFFKFLPTKELKFLSRIRKNSISINWLLIPIIVFVILHLISLGGSPAISGFSATTSEEAGQIRQMISENVHPLIAYGSSIILKSGLPFLLLFLLVKKKTTWYWIVFVVGSFYAFSLMQKSFILAFLMPSLIYSITTKRYLNILKYLATIVLVIIVLGKIANPGKLTPVNPEDIFEDRIEYVENQYTDSLGIPLVTDSISPSHENTVNLKPSGVGINRILYGLQRRVFVIPGEIVSNWFEHIPANKPFLYGDGYRLISTLKGTERRAYARELYPLIRPQNAKKGLSGSVNVASFMYDYANFGIMGLLYSGVLLALLFIFIERLFGNNFLLKVSLNFYPVLILSSGALTTILFSGGWAFILLFSLIFFTSVTLEEKKQ